MIFDTEEIVIGGTEWKTAPFRFSRMFTLSGGSGASYIDVLLSGVSPLVLTNANGLNYLKLFGGTEQRNLPSEYTQVEYLESSGTQYIDTGIVLNSAATIETVAQLNTSSVTGVASFWGFIGPSSGGSVPRWTTGIYSNKWLMDLNSTIQGAYPNADTNKHTFVNSSFYNNSDLYFQSTIDGVDVFQSSQVVVNPESYSTNTLKAYLFARNSGSGVTSYVNGKIYQFRITQNNILVINLIPCRRNSDNVLGMYDTVTGNFLTNSGTGTFTAGSNTVPTPDAPMDIVCNNGVLKLSPNLFNKDLVPNVNEYINRSNGNAVAPTSGEFRHSDYITIKENTQYYVGVITSTASSAGLAFYDDTKTYLSGISLTQLASDNNIITSPADTKYIRFSFRTDEGYNTNWQNTVYLVEGNQPLAEFIPYGAIYTDGTQETVTVTGNLVDFNETRINSSTWDSADKTKGFEVYADVFGKSIGSSMLTNANAFGVFVPCKQGESISLNFFNYTPYQTRSLYCEITADRKCNTTPQTYENAGVITQKTFTLTKNDSIGFIIEWWISSQQTRNYTKENYTVIKGTTQPTSYIPYFNGGSATAKMLLKVGDYKDVQSVLDGSVTRNVGIKVLDGTENYVKDGSRYYYTAPNMLNEGNERSSNLLCSHFLVSTTGIEGDCFKYSKQIYFYPNMTLCPDATAFKQWLSAQYNAGTPVIVIYPLATPTTESVTGQSLTVQTGTNIVTITQASIDNLTMELSYKQSI